MASPDRTVYEGAGLHARLEVRVPDEAGTLTDSDVTLRLVHELGTEVAVTLSHSGVGVYEGNWVAALPEGLWWLVGASTGAVSAAVLDSYVVRAVPA